MAEVAGEVKLLLTVDGTTWSAAIDRAQREIDKLKGKTTEASRVTKAEMTEARHAIHLLGEEIGVGLPRALQGFVAKLPGVAEAMSAAFNAVAVIGLAMVIVETGKKVYEFIEKTKKAAEESRHATEQFTSSREQANLEMEVANAKLEEQLAKLEKKPGDGLKTALAEARLEAFRLGQQLQNDVEEMHKLIETKLGASFLDRAIGMADSAGTLQQLDAYGDKVKEIANIVDPVKRTEEMRRYTGEQLDRLHEEIAARQTLQTLQEKVNRTAVYGGSLAPSEISQMTALQMRFGGGDQTKVLRGLAAFHDMVQSEYNKADLTKEQIQTQGKIKEQEGIRDREQLAKEALEALKRQTAERMTAYETDLANQKMMHQMSLEDERDFWQKRYMTGTNLGDPVNDLVARRLANVNQSIFKKQAEDAKTWIEMMTSLQRDSDRAAAQENPFALDRAQMANQGKTEDARMAALHDRPELLARIAAAQDEVNASEAVSSGLMKSQTLEIIKQTNVVARLQNELDELQGKRAAVAAMPSSTWTPGMNPEVLDNQIMQKQAELGAAQQTLQYQQERDTFGEQMRQMFQEWITHATDLRAAMSEMFQQSMDSVNNSILKTMTDPYHRGDWKATGKSIATGIAGKGLTAAEGSLMKALGLGTHEKLGTRGNPTWIRNADLAGAAAGSVAHSLLNGSLSGGLSGVLGGVSRFFGNVANKALGIPFFAGGGTLEGGMPAIVGESGPELFVPSGSGRIVPNDRLGGGDTHWHVDARGSSDPAAVRFQVQRAILEASPRIAAGSIAAARDLSARKPTMAR